MAASEGLESSVRNQLHVKSSSSFADSECRSIRARLLASCILIFRPRVCCQSIHSELAAASANKEIPLYVSLHKCICHVLVAYDTYYPD